MRDVIQLLVLVTAISQDSSGVTVLTGKSVAFIQHNLSLTSLSLSIESQHVFNSSYFLTIVFG